jgi:hypothetical protein
MSATYASTLERLRDIVVGQTEGYRRLLQATREGAEALRSDDMLRFDEILAEEVETLRELKALERAREETVREVGTPPEGDELAGLERDLKRLAEEVVRANRLTRFVIQRNGDLVEARLGLHRRAGTAPDAKSGGIDRVA